MLALALPIACGLLLAQLIPSHGRGSDSLLPSAIAVGVMRGLLAYPIAAWDGRWRLSVALVRGWTATAKIEAASSGEAIAIAKAEWDPLDDGGGWRRRLRRRSGCESLGPAARPAALVGGSINRAHGHDPRSNDELKEPSWPCREKL